MDAAESTSHRLTREELYNRIWAISAVRLAKELGVSDVAIAKACRKHEIPKPPPGYWAQLAVGKAPARPPLPPLADPKLQTITFSPPADQASMPDDAKTPEAFAIHFRSPELTEHLERIRSGLPSWEVPATLRSASPAVVATIEALRRCAKDKTRFIRAGEADLIYPQRLHKEACFSICVSVDQVERAGRLMQGLLAAATGVGFRLQTKQDEYCNDFCFELFDVKIQLAIREPTRRVPHVLTAKEREEKDRLKYDWAPKWDYVRTGMLRVKLSSFSSGFELRGWQDQKRSVVEEKVREIIVQMLAEVDHWCLARREQQERQRRELEEARVRQQAEERRKEEQRRADDLLQQVERWDRARRIRRYLRAVRKELTRRGISVEEVVPHKKWFDWAGALADRYDPLTPPDRSNASGSDSTSD